MRCLKILIIKGTSQYDQFRHICDEMLQSFCNLGCIASMLDLNSINPTSTDLEFISDYDILFSFNGIGIELYNSLKNRPFFWTFLVDHPFYHHSRLKLIDDKVMVSCIDRRHVEYIDRYYKNIPWTCFMPHGGLTGEPMPEIPYDDRKYSVIFMGSLGNMADINSGIEVLKKDLSNIIDPVIELALSDTSLDLEDIVSCKMNEFGISNDIQLFTDMMNILSCVDALRRHYKRKSLIEGLCKAGIQVDVWGNGWEQLHLSSDIPDSSRLNLHESINYNSAKDIMRNSKIILSDLPLFHDGSHERVFAAMESGAICATDRSVYLEECFRNDYDIIFYDNDRINSLANSINELLNDSDKGKQVIARAYDAVKYHSWEQRAKAILEITASLSYS